MGRILNNRYLKCYKFSETEREEIKQAIQHNRHRVNRLDKILSHIGKLKNAGVSFSRLWLRVEKILDLGRDSSSKRSHYYRYGLHVGYQRFKKKNNDCSMTRDEYIAKYGKEEAHRRLSRRAASLENYIRLYGETEGTERWNIYLQKRKEAYRKNRENGYEYARYNEDYYIRLYGDVEGKKRFRDKIDKQRYKVSLERYIEEFGEDGYKICKDIKDTQSLNSCVARHGLSEGTYIYNMMRDNRRGKKLDKYIEKYGIDEGTKRYEEYVEFRKFVPNIDGYITRYGRDLGIKLYQDCHSKSHNNRQQSVSNVSIQLFNDIKIYIPDLIHFGSNELYIPMTLEEVEKYSMYSVRVDCEYNGRIVEFNGDVYHANPSMFNEDDRPHPYTKNITAKELWKKDINRKKILENRGFEVMFVWERDFRENCGKVINDCVNWLLRK